MNHYDMNQSHTSDSYMESAPLKRHWEQVRSQETTPKKRKIDHRMESIEAIFEIDTAFYEWKLNTIHSKEKGKHFPKSIRLVLLNLEQAIFEAIECAHQEVNELYVPSMVVKAKGALSTEDGEELEPIKYKVHWANRDMEPSWVDKSFMEDYKDVMDDFWRSHGITFVKNEK